MEEFGRLTFPNSRTASPVIDARPGHHPRHHRQLGHARPGGGPVLCLRQEDRRAGLGLEPRRTAEGQFLFASAAWLVSAAGGCSSPRTGDGSVVCVNARTGEPLWRVPLFRAGINATVLVHQRRQGHRHLRHALRAGPDGRAQDARRAADQRRRRAGRARTQAARTLGGRHFLLDQFADPRRRHDLRRRRERAICARWTRTPARSNGN